MIASPSCCALLARYNLWQNASLLTAADTLDDAALRQDRGAFFESILGTFNHVLWADTMWMSRFEGGAPPEGGIVRSPDFCADRVALRAGRAAMDRRILGWAGRLTPEALLGDLAWYSGAEERDMMRPLGLCVLHFFNHQTHHRGQIHAMLTAAGARPGATDLFVMPEGVGL